MVVVALGLLIGPYLPQTTAGPEPGLFCEEGEMVHDRLFPEPDEVNDFIAFDEARCGLDVLTERHPDLIEVKELGQSVGWMNVETQEHDTFPVLAVEVTDETVPEEDKAGNLVFINSVHGNEKGAREGALRAIEDLLTGQGMASQVEEATGLSVDQALDTYRLVFTFPNPDGWVHEYPEYRPNDACAVSATCTAGVTGPGEVGLETQGFVRGNGNGTDLNRQYPTSGTPHASWPALTEPEIDAQVAYFDSLPGKTLAGVDLHGMLNAENLTYLMIKDTQRDLEEVVTHEHVARTTYGQLANDTRLDPWRATVGPASVWGSTYDLLGYSAPGTGGAYVVQDTGLDAPGFTVELAYNHIAFDNKYAGPGQYMNTLHVAAMRDIVLGFLEHAATTPTGVTVTGEATIGVLPHPEVIGEGRYDGTDADPNDAFREIDEHAPEAQITFLDQATPDALSGLTHIVVADRALDEHPPTTLEALQAWTEAGGTLILTDSALEHAEALGIGSGHRIVEDVTGKVDTIDKSHGLAATTYDPVGSLVDGNPLRYDAGTVPNHCLDSFEGTVVGQRQAPSDGGGMDPTAGPSLCTVLGEASLGDGTVRVMGAALPPPVTKGDHGTDGYALTPNGFRILISTMDLTLETSNGTQVEDSDAEGTGDGISGVPGATALISLAALAGAALAVRRRG